MAWEVWWALVLGFAISAIVQAWVPRSRIEAALAGSGPGPLLRATGLGAASSSCSYAAVAIGKSLFQKGASASSALAFQFASTNLVWELGLVLWVLIGWQFTLGEYVGGLVMIGLMALLLRLFVSPRLEEAARRHALAAEAGHQHRAAGTEMPLRARLTSASAWSDVAHNFRGDWQMLWKEITTGFVLAGFVGLLGNDVFRRLFLSSAPGPVSAAENAIVGPIIAVLSFVCSVGNVPLAAVLWSGGISFGGVMAFIFADLIVLPILAIYRKYYGWAFALRITALMFVTMVAAALAVDAAFTAVGLVPTARPTRGDIFRSIGLDYKLALNVLGLAIFAALFGLTVRRGATDPVCGMRVDRAKAVRLEHDGRSYAFCSEHCRARFLERASTPSGDPVTIGTQSTRRMAMSDYSNWHTGVEFDRDARTWRGYIEDNEYTAKHLTDETFERKEDAAVAASDMLTQAREGTPPGEAKTSGLPRI
jgi:uncharacterized membrane protein YraQ (UPF0718 family)/YHS domain-containing protein